MRGAMFCTSFFFPPFRQSIRPTTTSFQDESNHILTNGSEVPDEKGSRFSRCRSGVVRRRRVRHRAVLLAGRGQWRWNHCPSLWLVGRMLFRLSVQWRRGRLPGDARHLQFAVVRGEPVHTLSADPDASRRSSAARSARLRKPCSQTLPWWIRCQTPPLSCSTT